ncbi:S41 family peptidase [Massilia sp. TS11]|uniref:S41 family peptidase n=1 Tax=Massilia sp. TS11 TaxID=2908003 RepID=UPI001EDC52FA|nr:S41 family peptidase [Massilia sp. TS11]MCG2583160.1 S41 family peptidase [Massilia sp. TS11]
MFFSLPGHAAVVLVAPGAASRWEYLDDGKAATPDWHRRLNEAGWKSGAAPLGYGHPGNLTTLAYGPDARAKAITTYFRRQVDIADPKQIAQLSIDLRRDDGAVLYWNGVEVLRSNMPAGPVTAQTLAASVVQYGNEIEYQRHWLPAQTLPLRQGANILAVEIHQVGPTSSDIVFDLALRAYAPGEALPDDPYTRAYASLSKGDIEHCLDLLLAGDTDRAGYALLALAALERYLEQGGTTADTRYWRILELARRAAPDDMDVVYAWIRAHVQARKDLAIQPVRRPLPSQIDARWRFIADTPEGSAGPVLPRAALLADVDDLELLLENCYSYLERRQVDYRAALDALRASIPSELPVHTFQHRVARLMHVFGDSHSGLPVASEPRVPLRFVMDGERVAVLKYDRSGLLDAAHPYLAAINGIAAAQWLAAAEEIVSQSSPQRRRVLALEQLRRLGVVARQLQRPSATFRLTLSAAEAADTLDVPVALAAKNPPAPPVWPQHETAILPNNIAYLRLASMNEGPEFFQKIDSWMASIGATRGLIIDVRGNSGGVQDGIRTILPWLMAPGSPMKIINVAAYRLPLALPAPNRGGFLGLYERGLYPASSAVWSPQEAEQIRTHLAHWQPAWPLAPGKFSDWHVMAIHPSTRHGSYTQPVIVLQDAEVFSATDNFLGALKGHPHVTLMGTASGGGSGRMAEYVLPNSKLKLTLTQMASFTADGQLFDGQGIAPDIVLNAKLSDQLQGGGDSVLDAAIARLLGPAPQR